MFVLNNHTNFLHHGHVIYDQSSSKSSLSRIESIQCNAALAITGAIRGSPREKLFQELGLEHLHQRR